MAAIRTAVIGLGERTRPYIESIRRNELFDLVAFGDPDPALARAQADACGVRGYEDCRSLIVETARQGLGLLLVCLDPPKSKDLLRLAIERDLTVLTCNPFVRCVAEGLELIGAEDGKHLPLVVSQTWRYDPRLVRLGELTGAAAAPWLADVAIRGDGRPAAGWGDRDACGGGVLLYAGLPWIEWLTRLFGIPKRVYAECAVAPPPGQPRNYDTEDVAAVSLRFARDSIATLTLRRGAPPAAPRVALTGVDRNIELLADRIVTTRADGNHEVWPVEPAQPGSDEIAAVGKCIHEGRLDTITNALEHLAALSIVEAAYLSARTGSPESPSEFMS